MIFAKDVPPNKPSINETVASHIEHLTRFKKNLPKSNSAAASTSLEINNKYSTTTALAEKRNHDFEDIH